MHNFAPEAAEVGLALAGTGVAVRAVDLLTDGTADVREDGALSVDLAPYGCRWLRIVRPVTATWCEARGR